MAINSPFMMHILGMEPTCYSGFTPEFLEFTGLIMIVYAPFYKTIQVIALCRSGHLHGLELWSSNNVHLNLHCVYSYATLLCTSGHAIFCRVYVGGRGTWDICERHLCKKSRYSEMTCKSRTFEHILRII